MAPPLSRGPARASSEVEVAVRRIFGHQLGLATRSQLIAAGLSEAAITWRLGTHWRVVLPGVVRESGGILAPNQRVLAAQLYAGAQAQVTGQVACSFHGLRPNTKGSAVHILVPATCRRRDVAWARIRPTETLEESLHGYGAIRLTSPARAVVDWARTTRSLGDARALTIEAVQRRLVSLDELVHELERGPRRGSALVRRALVDVAAGAWSDPEAHLREVLGRTGLPELWMNPSLTRADGTRLTAPDGWFDEVALALMVHSRQFHSMGEDFDATVSSDADLTSAAQSVRRVPGMLTAAGRSGGMADTEHSKCFGRKAVRVQVPPSARWSAPVLT